MTDPAGELGRHLGYEFRDPSLITASLVHRSAGGGSNERLEFLGDAVVGLAVAELLYRSRPGLSEGDLTRARASLVNRDALASLARELGLGDYLVLGADERRSGAFQRGSILADALEAVFGAVFLDGGYACAREAVERVFAQRLAALPEPAALKDAKTRLQERLQSRGYALPVYTLAGSSGPEHSPRFDVECRVPDLDLAGSGSGGSRRKAEQAAAAAVLERLPW